MAMPLPPYHACGVSADRSKPPTSIEFPFANLDQHCWGTVLTLSAAVLPPVLGPVMMTARVSGRTQMSTGTCGNGLAEMIREALTTSDSLSEADAGPKNLSLFYFIPKRYVFLNFNCLKLW